ncbi:MAG TPA: DUF2336 domain-containing protein [Pseudolabrys sp.]|nr:DUF2336 domain-containing protein [Pseudolabrys sp.]
MPAPLPKNPIINEIESALRADSGDKRTKVLMSVTDLFIGGAAKYSYFQTKLFDDVLVHLIERVESSALVEIATRLASVPNAPVDTIRQLAWNDAIGISGPILSTSPRLSDSDLIEIAKTKSQAHLASIARRAHLNEDVTDVLVDHGDADVANEVAINSGALCSSLTMAKLVLRAHGDNQLTESMSRRTDIPPQMFHQLLTQATEVVRTKLLASAKPDQKDTIKTVMDEISTQVIKSPLAPRDYTKAKRTIAALSQDTNLIRTKVIEFTDTKHIAEVIAGLASINGLMVDQADKIFYAPTCFGLMILCKASALPWKTTYAVIRARPTGLEAQVASHDELHDQFSELSILSAQTLVRFWQGRQKVVQAVAEGRH